MKKYLSFLIFLFLFYLSFSNQSFAQLATWSFDENSGGNTQESMSNTLFIYQQGRGYLERTNGVSGLAFRSDGYSTWITGNLSTNFPTQMLSFSAWTALESYPVKTASIISIWNSTNNQGIEISINKFGQIVVRLNLGNGAEIFTSNERIPHYTWGFITVTINADTGEIKTYLNAELIINETITSGSLTLPQDILIGKSNSTQQQEGFDLNVLNGIIDEINIWGSSLSDAEISNQYTAQLPTTDPNMNVPAERFVGDYFRSQYHPIPQASWTNESHGLIYYNNQYHMFSQKNSNGPYFSNQNWGHFISEDLIEWEEVQPALWPQNQYDSVGTWAGHLILDDDNKPVIFYTGVDGRIASIHLARPKNDNLLEWDKPDSINPLIAESPFLAQGKDFRDPFIFKEGDNWYMTIGSGTPDGKGTLPLYKSTDLENWAFVGSLYTGNPIVDFAGSFWEVPVLWKFGSKYVLMITRIPENTNLARALYWVGDFVNEQFVPDNPIPKNFELINGALSPSWALDKDSNVVCIGIIPDETSAQVHYDLGWANLFTLPRVLTLDENTGTLRQTVHPNIERLEQSLRSYTDLNITPSGSNFLDDLRGFQYEIKASIQRGDANRVGLTFGGNSNSSEQSRIIYDYVTSEFIFERINATFEPGFPRDNRTGFYSLESGEDLNLRIFIDGSVIEVYINEEVAFSGRYFPSNADNNRIDLFAEGGTAVASNLEIFLLQDEPIPTGLRKDFRPIKPLKIFPNPSQEKIFLTASFKDQANYNLIIVDTQGNILKKQYFTRNDIDKPIDISDLPKGLYLCYVYSSEEKFLTQRIIVE